MHDGGPCTRRRCVRKLYGFGLAADGTAYIGVGGGGTGDRFLCVRDVKGAYTVQSLSPAPSEIATFGLDANDAPVWALWTGDPTQALVLEPANGAPITIQDAYLSPSRVMRTGNVVHLLEDSKYMTIDLTPP